MIFYDKGIGPILIPILKNYPLWKLINLFILPPLAGFAIWKVRKWSFWVFIAAEIAMLAGNIQMSFELKTHFEVRNNDPYDTLLMDYLVIRSIEPNALGVSMQIPASWRATTFKDFSNISEVIVYSGFYPQIEIGGTAYEDVYHVELDDNGGKREIYYSADTGLIAFCNGKHFPTWYFERIQ